jgi:hypothetical protein
MGRDRTQTTRGTELLPEPSGTSIRSSVPAAIRWASDNNALKVRGCIIISSGLGSDISKCLDMSFQ